MRRSETAPNCLLATSNSASAEDTLSRTVFISSETAFLAFSSCSMRPWIWAICSLSLRPAALASLIMSSAARISSRTCLSLPLTASSASVAFLSFSPSSASLSSDAAPNFSMFCWLRFPPTMAPDASMSSPCMVTILIPPMIRRAVSMSFTTRVSPRTYQNAL